MKALIIIPAYNEAMNIEKVIHDIKEQSSYDYIIIDDCSKDDTYQCCEHHGYNIIHLPINYGLASGVQAGIKYALKHGYEAVIQFDGDGQHLAKYIQPLFDALQTSDIVIGSRFVNEKKPFTSRMLGSRILSFMIRLVTGKRIKDPTSGMRAFNKSVMEEYASDMNYPPEPDTLVYMLKKGKKVKEVQVEMCDREFGESYLNPIRSFKYMLEMAVSILFIQVFRKR